MKVLIGSDSVATVTMSADELGIVRFAIATGVEKLQSTASYLKVMKSTNPGEYETCRDTADRAKAAQDELESACQRYCHS